MSPALVDTDMLVYVDEVYSAFHLPAGAALARLELEDAGHWISR